MINLSSMLRRTLQAKLRKAAAARPKPILNLPMPELLD
jgi:hypothetical protein